MTETRYQHHRRINDAVTTLRTHLDEVARAHDLTDTEAATVLSAVLNQILTHLDVQEYERSQAETVEE